MKTVFQADSIAEARMVADLLEREGFHAEIEGEHLAGAAGGLPAMGMVKVRVPESEATRAEQFIRALKWNESSADSKPVARQGLRLLLFFVLGIALGSVVTIWVLKTPYDEQGVDWDQDGNYEEKFAYAGETFTRTDYDRDDDGRIDAVQYFDRRGLQKEYRSDDNFDGRYDWRTEYLRNQPVRSEADIDGDGFAEMVARYRNGSAIEQDMLDPVSRKIRATYYFCSGKVVAANVDKDGDGEFDASVTYDFFGLEDEWSDELFEPRPEQCEQLIRSSR